MTDFTQAIALAPEKAYYAYLNRAWIYAENGDYDLAFADCEHILQLGIKNDAAYAHRSRVYYLQGDYKQAAADCARALELEPENEEAYGVRGLIYYQLHLYEKALSEFEKALKYGTNLFWLDREYQETCRIMHSKTSIDVEAL